LALAGALATSIPVIAQQKTGPGITDDDALTFHGVASGYAYHTTNINPTIGVRYKF
jgi:hypothetical protein